MNVVSVISVSEGRIVRLFQINSEPTFKYSSVPPLSMHRPVSPPSIYCTMTGWAINQLILWFLTTTSKYKEKPNLSATQFHLRL